MKIQPPPEITLVFKRLVEEIQKPGEYALSMKDGKLVSATVSCPMCGSLATTDNHDLVTEFPLHLEPYLTCEKSHRFYVRKGDLVYSGRKDKF